MFGPHCKMIGHYIQQCNCLISAKSEATSGKQLQARPVTHSSAPVIGLSVSQPAPAANFDSGPSVRNVRNSTQ